MIEQLRWVPVTERLPDAEISVLLWLQAADGSTDWGVGHWTGDGWLLDWCGAAPEDQVVAWAEPGGPGLNVRGEAPAAHHGR